jgi:ABC-type bacteriocin/lantibiotic exporter with double-glycine peptidase domain
LTVRSFTTRYFPYFKRYRLAYTIAFLLLALMSALSLLPPLLIRSVVDRAIAGHNSGLLWRQTVYLVVLVLFLGLCRGFMDYLHEWAGNRVIASLRNNLLEKLLSQDMKFYTVTRVGELLGRLRTDTTRLYGTVMSTLLALCSDLVQALGISGLLLWMNWKLALVALSFVIPMLATTYLRRERLQRLALEFRDKDVGLLDFAQELFTNISLVKLLSGEQYVRDRHFALNADLVDSGLENVRYKFVSIYLIGIFSALPSIVVLYLSALAVIHGTMSVGSLIAFYLFVTRVYGPIQSLAGRAIEISSGLASATRIEEFLALPDKEEWRHLLPHRPHLAGALQFRDVSFTYPGRKQPALANVSFAVNSGERIVVIGESGAGKSTLIHLMTRLYEPSSGYIEIAGKPLNEQALPILRRSIGVVSQDVALFNDTIEGNIRFGDFASSAEDILAAIRLAGLEPLLGTLPLGLQTAVGPRGLTLSGGQRQRLALARMLLRRPDIWILDEPTSSLDSVSAVQIFERLKDVTAGVTTIVVTHDHSRLLEFDRVLTIEKGHMLSFSSPHDYLAKRREEASASPFVDFSSDFAVKNGYSAVEL